MNDSFAGIYRKKINQFKGLTKLLLFELVTNCNFCDNPDFRFDNYPYPLKRGQLVTSLKEGLSKDTGLTVSQIRTILKKLVNLKIITDQSTGILANRARLITIIDIDKWLVRQGELTDTITDTIADPSQTPNKPLTTNNNNNNNNNENNEIQIQDDKDLKFNEFWKLYPEKKGKDKCKKVYIKLTKDHEKIITGLKLYINHHEFLKSQKKSDPRVFIPNYLNPLTFLNQKRWEDEYTGEYQKKAESMKKEDIEKKMEAEGEILKNAEKSYRVVQLGYMNKKYSSQDKWNYFKDFQANEENKREVNERFKKFYPKEYSIIFKE